MSAHFFFREAGLDRVEHRELVCDPVSGSHRFFRMSGPRMQVRFAELVDHSMVPKVLIHGNPHVANYCKTRRGAAMADFDRSRVGPYAYDIVRFLISVSLCRQVPDETFLHPIITEQFRRGYLYGFSSQTTKFEEMSALRDTSPKDWQQSTNDYLKANKKWARKLRANQTKITKRHIQMLKTYLGYRNELKILERYQLTTCAEVAGSMGKLHHLYLLKDRKGKKDAMLIDIKEIYEETDNEWYHNPFKHHGKRMNVAGSLYAPGWEQRPGRSQYKGQQYWVRQIPTQQSKLKLPLTQLEQCDLCYAVGSQLGSGHARGADKKTRAAIHEDFKNRFADYLSVAHQMRYEVLQARADYMKKAIQSKLIAVAH